jgi:hypothetical protein
MTKQEIFDWVARHLIEQGEKSLAKLSGGPNTACAYRGDNDMACAAGCLMVDGSGFVEGVRVECARNITALQKSTGHMETPIGGWYEIEKLLSRLQRVHDGYCPEEWPTRLHIVASEFSLDPQLIDTLTKIAATV